MKKSYAPLAVLLGIFFLAGCATTYRKNLETYQSETQTPFYEKTLRWTTSATDPASVPAVIESATFPVSIQSATDVLYRLTEELFSRPPEHLREQMDFLSNPKQMETMLSQRLRFQDLSLAVVLYNPAVKAARQRWNAALRQYDQASFLEGLISEYRTFTRYLDVEIGKPFHKQMMQDIFPSPGGITLKGEMIREEVRMAELDWQRTLRDQIIQAGRAFYDDQYQVRGESSTRDNVSLVENMLHVIEDRYRTGSASQSDLIKIQTELEKQKKLRTDYQSRQAVFAAQINALLNRPANAPLAKPDPNDLPHPATGMESWIETARTHRQELRIQESKAARTAIAIRMGEAMNRPSASQGFSQFERGMMPEASAEKSLPAFGLKAKTTLRPAYAQAESFLAEMRERFHAEQADYDQIKRDTEALAVRMQEEWTIALRQIDLMDQIVLPQSQTAYEIILSRYQSGSASFLDLLDAERELIDARLESHQAHRDANQALLQSAAALGLVPS